MFQSRFADLVREKEYRDKRHLSLRTIAEESGLSINTISRVKSGNLSALRMSTFEALCAYFEVQSVADLLEYVPSNKE